MYDQRLTDVFTTQNSKGNGRQRPLQHTTNIEWQPLLSRDIDICTK